MKKSSKTKALKKCSQLKKDLQKFMKEPKEDSLHILSTRNIRYARDIMDTLKFSERELVNKAAKEKFATSIGIEYTFLIENPEIANLKAGDENYDSEKLFPGFHSKETFYSNKLSKELDKRQSWNRRSHRDGDNVVESPSPIHHNWNDMLSHYKLVTKAAKKVGLVTHKEGEGGGGGHIHLGIPKHLKTSKRLHFLANVFLDVARRPYLNWIFNEPVDVLNANSMLTTLSGIKFIRHLNDKYSFDLHSYGDMIGNYKDYGIRYCEEYDTVEFRFFDMPRDEQNLEEHVEFVNAYYNFMLNGESHNNNHSVNLYNINPSSFDVFKNKRYVVKEFNRLLKHLGLNPKRYKKYIERNYNARLEMAKAGLIKMDYDILNGLVIPKEVEPNNEFTKWTGELTANVVDGYEGEVAPVAEEPAETSPEIIAPDGWTRIENNINHYSLTPGATVSLQNGSSISNNSQNVMFLKLDGSNLSIEPIVTLETEVVNNEEQLVYNLSEDTNIIEQ